MYFIIRNAICKNYLTLNSVKHLRNYSNSRVYEEIRIPVPWGHLAGKWWGPQDKRPILALHGWQDNCGTFDKLTPYLPEHIGVLAMDFPGHGLSSHIPAGMFYHGIDSSILIRRIVQYFNWPKVSLLGHSLGAITNYLYSTLYPASVDFLICIDGIKPLVFDVNVMERMVKTIEDFLKYDELRNIGHEPPSYSYEVLIKMLHEGSRKSISLDNCKYILNRNIKRSSKDSEKFYFARDPRLKVSVLQGMTQQAVVDSLHRLTCPTLMIKALRAGFVEKKEYALEVLDKLKTFKNFEYHEVDGTHHVHLNNPEMVEGIINAFIRKYDVGDRALGNVTVESIKEVNYVN